MGYTHHQWMANEPSPAKVSLSLQFPHVAVRMSRLASAHSMLQWSSEWPRAHRVGERPVEGSAAAVGTEAIDYCVALVPPRDTA